MTPTSTTPDETLVARMTRRDQEALSSLYDRYRGVVFALALRILRERAEAEEVLTDVFLQAWRQADGFDRLRGSVHGWLFNICRSRAIDRLRARGRREVAAMAATAPEQRGAAPFAGVPRGPEEESDLMMKRQRIGAALGSLSPAQKHAIELAFYDGLSHTEIAARLGEPLGTVKTRIRQGLIALRENLGAQFGRVE
jgi:RNA polymerase sigma-70 factor, ECF subfamily